MKFIWVLTGGISLGFALGYLARDATVDAPPTGANRNGTPDLRPGAERRGAGEAESAEPDGDPARRVANRDRRAEGDGRPRERRSRGEALVAFRDALERGDRGAMHDALHDLSRRGGEPLSAEELAELGALLHEVDEGVLEELSHALVMSGGADGIALVMAFAGDNALSLEMRERVLHGLARVPREMADAVLPALADFLESGSPQRLQHSAAHAIGRMFRDEATEALLGLLADRPGIPAEAIFDAIGNTGRAEDTETLLGMLSEGWSGRDRMGLLRAVGRVATRVGDPDFLIDMMRNPPAGVSKSMVAEAISDSAHHLGTTHLREALLEVSGDRRAQERLARALVESGGQAGLDALLELAASPDYELDGRALAHALHDSRGPNSASLMMEMFRRSEDGETAESLAWGMLRNGDSRTVDELMGLLESGSESQRRAIAHTLPAVRDERGGSLDMDRLVGALRRETNPEVGSELARSLSRSFGEQGFQEVERVLRESRESEQRHSLMWGLEEALRSGEPRAAELFVDLAEHDPAPDVRRHAVEIIQHQRDSSMLPVLERLLEKETHPEVQEHLRGAIDRLKS